MDSKQFKRLLQRSTTPGRACKEGRNQEICNAQGRHLTDLDNSIYVVLILPFLFFPLSVFSFFR